MLTLLHNKKKYDISGAAEKISFQDKMNDGCSKLSITLRDDFDHIDCGDAVAFSCGSCKIFSGFVFEVETNEEGSLEITAYDQLRYGKAKDTIVVGKKDTASSLVKRMIRYLGLIKGEIADTGFFLPESIEEDKTWLDIVYDAMDETFYGKEKKYILRDEGGKVCLREQSKLFKKFIIGDQSLAYGYEYSKSIDDDFYNQIKLMGEVEKELVMVMERSSASIKKYGTLQYFKKIENVNKAKLHSLAKTMLKSYNRLKKSCSIEALGEPSVRAGDVIGILIGNIGDLHQGKKPVKLMVDSVTHDFLPYHTMKIEFIDVYEKEG